MVRRVLKLTVLVEEERELVERYLRDYVVPLAVRIQKLLNFYRERNLRVQVVPPHARNFVESEVWETCLSYLEAFEYGVQVPGPTLVRLTDELFQVWTVLEFLKFWLERAEEYEFRYWGREVRSKLLVLDPNTTVSLLVKTRGRYCTVVQRPEYRFRSGEVLYATLALVRDRVTSSTELRFSVVRKGVPHHVLLSSALLEKNLVERAGELRRVRCTGRTYLLYLRSDPELEKRLRKLGWEVQYLRPDQESEVRDLLTRVAESVLQYSRQ